MPEITAYCDFHCHLDDECFEQNRWQLIDRCFAAGIVHIVSVADPFKEESLLETERIVAYKPGIFTLCGAHPHHADHYTSEIEGRMIRFIAHEKNMAIGEVGLDFHYDFASRANQVAVFKRQIAIAREQKMPLVIHSRNAEAEVLQILADENFDLPVVFHCFTGSLIAATEIVRRGYSISVSGIVTFKKADALRQIVEMIPLPQLFSETDSPYLAPEPKRGEVNTPLNVIRVVEKIAVIKNISVERINAAIVQNLERLRAKNQTAAVLPPDLQGLG